MLQLQLKGVVRILGYNRWPDPENGVLYLIMEYIEGRTLRGHVLAANPSIRQALHILRALAQTLATVLGRGVLHRDLKLDNIMVTAATGEPVLLDFGLSCMVGATPLDGYGLVAGTIEYVSPEAWRFYKEHLAQPVRYEHTEYDDLWALGVTYYWVLARRLPFGTRADKWLVPHACVSASKPG